MKTYQTATWMSGLPGVLVAGALLGCSGGVDGGGGLRVGTTNVGTGAGPTVPGAPTEPGLDPGVTPGAEPASSGAMAASDPANSEPTGAAEPTPDAEGNLPFEEPLPGTNELPARAWRLTHEEYQLSVAAFLGVTPDISYLPGDVDNGIYPNQSSSGFVRVELADDYYDIAEELTNALTDAELAGLIPCGQVSATCKDEFIQATLTRAFRRPATAEDTARYSGLFDLAATSEDTTLPFRAVLRGALTSPYFLYRTEIGAPENQPSPTFELTGAETASLLSYSLTGHPPSQALLDAGSQGQLTVATALAAQVQNLLNTPEAADQQRKFMTEWLKLHQWPNVEKFDSDFPGFSVVRDAMFDEAEAFFAQSAGLGSTLTDLLTTPVPAATGPLGNFYRSEASFSGDETRIGVLGLGAVMSTYAKAYLTSPTLRGNFVRERILCQHVGIPEDLDVPDIAVIQETQQPATTRELYQLHTEVPTCAGCHQLIDNIGFMFETLDGAGRFRTTEGGVPLDTSGTLLNTDVNGVYNSHGELAMALSQSEWVKECAAIQGYRFYLGQPEQSRGQPAIVAGRQALAGGTLSDMVVALMSSVNTTARNRN